jgi:hypothetical protein
VSAGGVVSDGVIDSVIYVETSGSMVSSFVASGGNVDVEGGGSTTGTILRRRPKTTESGEVK